MIKRMQWYFTLVAMAVLGTVMLILAAGINVLYYSITTSAQDRILAQLLEARQESMFFLPEGDFDVSEVPLTKEKGSGLATGVSAAYYDSDGDECFIPTFSVSFIDEDTIKQYAGEILSVGKRKGFYKQYRYRVGEGENKGKVVFLDAFRELNMISTLFKVSVIGIIVSLSVVFVLMAIISRWAVKPFINNFERQKRFVTDASHELKTPLTSIIASADILAMESEENEWVANIQKQSVRMKHLVASLVTLSRLDEGIPFPEKEVFSFTEAAWEIAEPFAVLARAKGKAYTGHIEECLEFRGDRSTVQQMISILLDNAVRYSGEGGEIQLDIYRRHGKIITEVFNSCELPKGIEEERLFDRFYRPDESRSVNSGGAGIGLSIAQAIAKAHGGKITVKCPDKDTIRFKAVL